MISNKIKPGPKPKNHQEIINKNFDRLIELVENGSNITIALKKLGIDRRYLSNSQKCLVQIAKTSNTKYGMGSTFLQSRK